MLAYGRDPYFSGWPDTVQLNYQHAGLREAMLGELGRVAGRCDGVRCDMAMLVQPEVFRRTWGDRRQATRRLTCGRVSRSGTTPSPGSGAGTRTSCSWPRCTGTWSGTCSRPGFDYTYDKRLYDRLVAGHGRSAREHLLAAPDFQDHSLRFLENHDEPRAAATFQPAAHRAAALITFTVPGLRLFYEGQLEGRKAFVSMHLGRRPVEVPDPEIGAFYRQLLACLRRPEPHEGAWRMHACRPAWDGNSTWEQFYVATWESARRAAAGGGQLRRQPGPVLCHAAAAGAGGPSRSRWSTCWARPAMNATAAA